MDDKNTEKVKRQGTADDAVDNETDESAPAFEDDDARASGDQDLGSTKVIEGEDDADEPMDWGERWKITRQFASMSRSSAILMISFLLVLLLYLWVKEDPLVTVPANDPAETSETADPSATTESTGETSATGTSDAEPTESQDASTVPTGAESADPMTGNQGAGESQVPTQDNTGQNGSQTGDMGDSGTNSGNGTGGTDGTGGQTGQGTQGDASAQGAEAGQSAGTGETAGTGAA